MKISHILIVSGIVACTAIAVPVINHEWKAKTTIPTLALDFKASLDTNLVFPTPPSTVPALLIHRTEGDSNSVPLRITDMKMDVKVTGNISTTRMEMTFYNDVDRELEGQLVFPLGEGQTVSYYALEIGGEMREASVVGKEEGRKIFEEIVRRKVDPGLIEWTKGNNFRTRIYPIPAHGTKKIIIGFDQELVSTGRSFLYIQPMFFHAPLDKFSLKCEVLNSLEKPVLFGDDRQTLEFKNWESKWVAEMNEENFHASHMISFEVPLPADKKQSMVNLSLSDSNAFWLAVTPPVSQKEKKLPEKVTLFWDVSGSSDSSLLQSELEVIASYFKKIGDMELNLVLFANEIVYNGKFQLFEGNWDAAIRKIKEAPRDGGTQLGCIHPENYKADEFILVSDALSNFGVKEFNPGNVPFITITSSKSADHSYLKYVALASNGTFINLVSQTKEDALRQMCYQPYRFLSATYLDSQISETYPSVPTDLKRTFTLSGIIKKPIAEIQLNFGHGNQIEYTEKVLLRKADAVNVPLVSRCWAQKKLSQLDIRPDKNKEAITDLGKTYEIVTRNTSLLVLDNIDDYVRYKVKPKDPKMLAQYTSRIEIESNSRITANADHLNGVIAQFKERKEWWEKEFNFVPPPKVITLPPPPPNGADIDSMRTDSSVAVQFSTVLGANAGTVYNWSFGDNMPVNAGSAVSFAAAGSYNVTVTDANACLLYANPSFSEDGRGKMNLKEYDPQTPYIQKLKNVSTKQRYLKYLSLKKEYAKAPSFYLDVANYFFKMGDKKNGLRILSNIAEMQLEDAAMLRILAHRLQQLKQYDLAAETFKDVKLIRGEEPQSYRDLGLCYAEMGKDQLAVDELCQVINRNWDGRFPGVELVAVGEVNTLLSKSNQLLQLDSLHKDLIKAMPVDVRVVINWNTDACDVDLWVTDPYDHKCYYGNRETPLGGKISQDFTGGYGPEEFLLKKAAPGPYRVDVHFYGSSMTTLSGPVTVQAEMFTNYGRRAQKKETMTLRLEGQSDLYYVGEFIFAGNN